MDGMENGVQEQIVPNEPTATQPQDAATPAQTQAEETESRPEVYFDDEGNLQFGEDLFADFAQKESEEQTQPETEEQQTEEPKLFKVKVDGVEEEVTLDELLNGYSRTKDYTNKTQKLSEERKRLESERAEINEQIKLVELQTRYGVPITTETQKQISAQADAAIRQRFGNEVDVFSQETQDVRSMLMTQLTSQYSEQVKASQRMQRAEQVLRKSEPNFEQINQLAMHIARTEMNFEQFTRLQRAQAAGDPTPLLEVFDVARERVKQTQQKTNTEQPSVNQQPAHTVQASTQTPRPKTPEPPRTESASGKTIKEPTQAKFDFEGFSKMSASEQVQALIKHNLV